MMKYLLLALAVTAVSAQIDDADIDAFLEADMALPCTPKPCVPVCRPVTKYLAFGSFKIPYVENVCAPDHKCLAAAAACVAKLQAAMADAHKKGLALEAASKAKNAAHASKASKDKAAAARKAEAAAAATALGLAKAAFEAAEKEAANAKAAKESASKMYTAKAAVMDARLKSYEKAQQAHKNAVAAYDGAKSEAAKAAAAYAAAVKAHCDAEAQHAAAVKNIGHGHLAQKNCAKYETGPKNMLPNGGFELGSNGREPTDWMRYGRYGNTGLRSSEQAHSGSHSIKYTGGGWQLIENGPSDSASRLNLKKGQAYKLTFWARSTSSRQSIRTEFLNYPVTGSKSHYSSRVYTSSGSYVKTHHTSKANTWQQFTHTFTPSKDQPIVRLNIGPPGVSGSLYVDDVVLSPA